jgi:thioredoxin-related protein
MMSEGVTDLLDLQREMAELAGTHKVILLLASRSDCPYCREVRRNYLQPLARSAGDRLVVRELVSDTSGALTGPDGESIAPAALLGQLKVRFYPTVVFLGSGMRRLSPALVGLDQAGFYNAYLDERIAQALSKA